MTKLDQWQNNALHNRWLRYFTILVRVALAFGFLTAGMVKIMGERFASGLSVNHPMGHYLEAVAQTGFYYTFIGITQVVAAILLLVPRTAPLGALLYFPIIVNICVLSLALRFEGALLTSPLMVLSNLYLLCWDYDKLRYLITNTPVRPDKLNSRFPFRFFALVAGMVILLITVLTFAYDIMPRNSLTDCEAQCKNSKNPEACKVFCEGIHHKGEPLDKALEKYHQSLSR